MEPGRTGRQLAALVQLRRDTDRNTEDTFRLAEKILDDNAELTEELEELKANPVYTLQDWQKIKSLEVRDRQSNDIRMLEAQIRDRGATINSYEREIARQAQRIDRLVATVDDREEQIERLSAETPTTRVIALETMLRGQYAYQSQGTNSIHTIDRLRGPIWKDRNRGESALVHEVGENIKAGDEVKLVYPRNEWVWMKVAK